MSRCEGPDPWSSRKNARCKQDAVYRITTTDDNEVVDHCVDHANLYIWGAVPAAGNGTLIMERI